MSGALPASSAGHRTEPVEARLEELVARRRRAPGADTVTIVERMAGLDPEALPVADPLPVPGLTDLVEVGRGGMGVVYRARETRLGRTVAVKVLAAGISLTDEARHRAEREAMLLTRVVHPNIVQILYVTDVDGAPAIVMEWIDGPSLESRVDREAIAMRDAVAIVADLARGVAALHAAGIVHRDIKPANVLVAEISGATGPVPKLVDFGLARCVGGAGPGVTRACTVVGTPSFMAPEQTGLDPSLGAVGPAADVHALGGLLYWLLGGRAPYDADSTSAALERAARGEAIPLRALVARLPADIETIVGRCLEQRPGDRYASAAALADDLRRFLDHRPILARPAGWVEHVIKWVRRRPAVAALVAGAFVAVLALAGGAAYHLQRLQAATVALEAGRDQLIVAQSLARKSFERLTDASAERFLARGAALDGADRDHLRRIRDEYLAWPLEPDPAAGLRYRAAGLERLARIFDRLHWGPDALDSVRAALEALDEVEARGDATPEDERRRVECVRLEVAMLCRSGRIDEALGAAREEVARLEPRASAGSGTRRLLAVAWGDLANLEATAGHHAASMDHRRRSVELSDTLVEADPEDGDLLRLSLPLLYNAAISPSIRGPAERREYAEKLLSRAADGLARFQEGREEMGRGLLLALTMLAHDELGRGRPAEALELARRRAGAARALADEMPGVHHFRAEVAGAACQASACLMALGRPGDGEADLGEAVSLAAEAVNQEPAVADRTRVLVEVLFVRAEVFAATGRREEAAADLRRVLESVGPWTESLPAGHEPPPGFAAALEKARDFLKRLAGAEGAPEARDTRPTGGANRINHSHS